MFFQYELITYNIIIIKISLLNFLVKVRFTMRVRFFHGNKSTTTYVCKSMS
jgi:hypothetical protein